MRAQLQGVKKGLVPALAPYTKQELGEVQGTSKVQPAKSILYPPSLEPTRTSPGSARAD